MLWLVGSDFLYWDVGEVDRRGGGTKDRMGDPAPKKPSFRPSLGSAYPHIPTPPLLKQKSEELGPT